MDSSPSSFNYSRVTASADRKSYSSPNTSYTKKRFTGGQSTAIESVPIKTATRLLEALGDGDSAHFGDSFLSDEGVVAIVDALRHNKSVTSLDLKGNNIKNQGIFAISELIQVNNTIKTLVLEWNNIGLIDSGIKALSDALCINTSIQTLDLRNNRIGPTGCAAIAKMLINNSTLTSLDLRWNDIGIDGGSTLADALTQNTSLKSCHVSGNKLGEKVLKVIEDSLKRNRKNGPKREDDFEESSHLKVNSSHFNDDEPIRESNSLSQSATVTLSHPIILSEDLLAQTGRTVQLEEELHIEKSKVAQLTSQLTAEVHAHTSAAARVSQLEAALNDERSSSEDRAASIRAEYNKAIEDRSKAELNERLTKENSRLKENEKDKLIQSLESKIRNLMSERDSNENNMNRTEIALGALKEQVKMAESSCEREKELRLDAERKGAEALQEYKKITSENENNIRREFNSRISLGENRITTAENSRISAENARRKAETDLFEARLKFEEELVSLENKVRNETEFKMNAVLDDTTKRLKDLQVARDTLASRADAASKQLIEVQNRAASQIQEYEKLLSETKIQLDETEVKFRSCEVKLETISTQNRALSHKVEQLQNRELEHKKQHESLRKLHEEQLDELLTVHAKEKKEWEDKVKKYELEVDSLEADLRTKTMELTRIGENHDRNLTNLEQSIIDKVKHHIGETRGVSRIKIMSSTK